MLAIDCMARVSGDLDREVARWRRATGRRWASSGSARWGRGSSNDCSTPATRSPGGTAARGRPTALVERGMTRGRKPAGGRRARRRGALDGHRHGARSRRSPDGPDGVIAGPRPGSRLGRHEHDRPRGERGDRRARRGRRRQRCSTPPSRAAWQPWRRASWRSWPAASRRRSTAIEPVLLAIGPKVRRIGDNGKALRDEGRDQSRPGRPGGRLLRGRRARRASRGRSRDGGRGDARERRLVSGAPGTGGR